MESLDSSEINCFEDITDMMDYSYEKLQDAIYHFCLCTKLGLGEAEPKVIKALLILFVESEFEDVYTNLFPYVEMKGKESLVYGIINKNKKAVRD